MNSFKQEVSFSEIISQLIDNLNIIKDNCNEFTPIDKDTILEQLRKSYIEILQLPTLEILSNQLEDMPSSEPFIEKIEEKEEIYEETHIEIPASDATTDRTEELIVFMEEEDLEKSIKPEEKTPIKEEIHTISEEKETKKVETLFGEEEIITELPSKKSKSSVRSLNDLLHEQREENSLLSKIQHTKIDDLSKAISINDKFLFIKELFRNQGEEFSKAIQTLNHCETMEGAFTEIERLKQFYFWDSSSPAYLSLCDLVRRKFA